MTKRTIVLGAVAVLALLTIVFAITGSNPFSAPHHPAKPHVASSSRPSSAPAPKATSAPVAASTTPTPPATATAKPVLANTGPGNKTIVIFITTSILGTITGHLFLRRRSTSDSLSTS